MMKLFMRLLLLVVVVSPAYAMQEAFDEALKIGTKAAIEQCIQQYNIDLHSKCMLYQVVDQDTKALFFSDQTYPIKYVIYRYGSSNTLSAKLQILMDLGVSIDGYDDFNPLVHAIGANTEMPILVLLGLGADPQKKVLYNKKMTTPLEHVLELIRKEDPSPRVKTQLNWLHKIHTQLVKQYASKKDEQLGGSPVNPTLVLPSTPEVTRTTSKNDPIVGVQDSDSDNDEPRKSSLRKKSPLFVYGRAAIALVTACLCGVVGKLVYDWCFKSGDTETEKSEPEGVTDEVAA